MASIWDVLFGGRPVHAVWVGLKTGSTIKGVLVDRTREMLVIRAGKLGSVNPTNGQESWVPMTGDVCIPMDNVDYWQEGIDPHALD